MASMDAATVDTLNRLTSSFYARYAESFSRTRRGSWPGWERIADELASLATESRAGRQAAGPNTNPQLSLLDLASGNGRFEGYLAARLPHIGWHFHTVDNCPAFRLPVEADTAETHHHTQLDLVQALSQNGGLPGSEPSEIGASGIGASRFEPSGIGPSRFDACVSFGFLHHVPGRELRAQLLREMLACVRPGGLVTVSLWRFMDSAELARDAEALRPAALAAAQRNHGLDTAQMEPGDYLLGWQGDLEHPRYCHHFADGEVDWLVEQLGRLGKTIARYRSDGRTRTLNEYLILRRK